LKRYCITDSLDVVSYAAASGAEMIQVRAKTLSGRDLLAFARQAVVRAGGCPVLVNSRFDIALAAGAQGVHLPAHSIAPALIRRLVPSSFRIGVSCHAVDEIRAAQKEGADFVVFGPVFTTRSKPGASPVGLPMLREVCREVEIPVYALGGVTRANAPLCIEAGAAGVAGISLFRPGCVTPMMGNGAPRNGG
jgi:thiamine-phosphate pyrophosphorylase